MEILAGEGEILCPSLEAHKKIFGKSAQGIATSWSVSVAHKISHESEEQTVAYGKNISAPEAKA